MTTRRAALVTDHLLSSRASVARGVDFPGRLVRRLRGFLGRHISVRWKLTLWYGLMCAVTLGLVGAGMRAALDFRTQSLIDASFRSTATLMLQKLHQRSTEYADAPTFYSAFQDYENRISTVLKTYSTRVGAPGQFEQVELVDPIPPAGKQPYVFIPSPVHPGVLDPQFPLLLSQAASSGRPITAAITLRGEPVRVYFTPLSPPLRLRQAGVVGVLEIFQPEHTYLEIQQDFSRILLFGIPLGLLIATAVGWWIARAALRPIDRISRTVQAIGESRDLSRRLEFVGPADEIRRLAFTFDDMMDRLEKVFETQKRFIADASHELRTPLTAIRGNAELYTIAPPGERDQCVTSIRREAERMSRLVADLLLLAAADVEEQPVHMRPVDLDDLLMDVCRSALVLADGKVSVECEPVEPVRISADPDRLKQLVLNLVDNAIKFTPAGGSVTLSLYAEPNAARIVVSDTGTGIPPDDQEAIFRRFYRVEEARTRRGSGLGLAICAWIVAAHQGKIDVQSTPGKGSVFSVWLPRSAGAPGHAVSVTSQPKHDRA